MSESETITMYGDDAPVRQLYAVAQVIARRLYDDKPALKGLQLFLIEQHVERRQLTRVDDEHRVAFSFGKLHHDERLGDPHECGEHCTILPCSEADATAVMMMIEFGIEVVPDADE